MFKNKKAIHTHIRILLIVSFGMTFLFTTIASPLFTVDHPNCVDYNYEVIAKCKRTGGVEFTIKSEKNMLLDFNTEKDKAYKIEEDSTKKFSLNTPEDNLKITPYFTSLKGDIIYECKGKSTSININNLLKC